MEQKETKKPIGIIPYLVVLLVAAALIALVLIATRKKEQEPTPETSSAEETETDREVDPIDAMKMEDLIRRYYKARMEADADTMNGIVVSDKSFNAAELAAALNIVKKYDGFYFYVIPSETPDYYVVYVTYDMYFPSIDAGAPSLDYFTVKRNGDGFVIYDKFVSIAFEEELAATKESTVVKNLRKQVDEDLEKACAENEDLRELMDFLKSSEPESSETEQPTEKPTETETEPVESEEETGSEEEIELTETEDQHN